MSNRLSCFLGASLMGLVTIGCGDDEPTETPVVTQYDGSYAVTLTRDSGQTATTCFAITDGAFAIAGLNSEGFPFEATGAVNEGGNIIVSATLGDENTTVGVVATVDADGAVTGDYSISSNADVVGQGTVEGASVESCPEPPELPSMTNLSDHYGVRATVPTAAGTLSVTTYNLGLAPTFVPFTAERLVPNLDALAAFDTDVMCLQEVWLDSHVEAVKDAVLSTYPHSYSIPAEQVFTDGAPCTAEEVAPIKQCIDDNCGDVSGDEFTTCAIASCSEVLFALNDINPTCGAAIIAQVGSDDIEAAFEAVQNPTGLFAFGGATGLIIVSKHTLTDTQALDFIDTSTSNHRAVLFATVNVDGVDHKVGCTHLTANLGNSVPYSGPLASWEAEGAAQAEAMITFANTYAGTDATYLGGDFNCSIPNAATGVIGDFEGNCQQFLDDGYTAADIDQLGCSFCDDNILNTAKGGGGGEGALLLDHVFTKNVTAGAITTELVFNQLVSF